VTEEFVKEILSDFLHSDAITGRLVVEGMLTLPQKIQRRIATERGFPADWPLEDTFYYGVT
jgi:hypothetical protein